MTSVVTDVLDELAVHRPLVVDLAELGLGPARRGRQRPSIERGQLALQRNANPRRPRPVQDRADSTP